MRRTAPWVLSVLLLAVVACGGRGGAVSKAPLGGLPAKEAAGGGGEAAARRPANTVAWVHVENLLAWGLLFGVDPAKAAESDTLKSAGEIVAVLDLSRPADAAASMSEGDETADWAAVVPVQDTGRFLQAARKEYDVAEKKSRYTLTKKKKKPDGDGDPSDPSAAPPPDDGAGKPKAKEKEKELVCELHDKPAPTAVCGSPRGLADLAPWLRTGPKLPGVDMSVEVYMRPLRRTLHDAIAKSADTKAAAVDPSAPPPTPTSDDDKKSAAALERALDDFEKLSLGLEAKGKEVHFSTRATFRSAESEWTKHLFASTSPVGNPELLYRLTEGSSAAFYSAGGGPLVKLLGSMDWFDKLPEAEKPRAKAAQAQAVALLERPWAAGYGVDVAAVKKVLAEHKTAKDAAAWQKSLSKAIDGYAFFALTADVAAFEKLAKELVRAADLDAKQPPKGAAAPSHSVARTPPAPKAFRAAPAGLGLPKGSFFVDETKEVVEGPELDPKTHKPNTKKVRRTAPTMLAVGEGAQTFVVAGLDDDRAYAGAAKRILGRKPEPREMDPYFRQGGLVLGGEVTTLIGAFASHEIGMAFKPSMSAEDRDKLVADLEGDLAQRLVIPFALAVERRGPGGMVSFDVRGEAAAFRTLGEHAAAGLGLAALFLLIPVMGMFGGP